MTPEELELKRTKLNEHMKLFTGTFNAVGLGILAIAVVKPFVSKLTEKETIEETKDGTVVIIEEILWYQDLQWDRIALGIFFCVAAHIVIRFQR